MIASYGSQLADIAWSISQRDRRDDLLVEGALFNTAVALFDTIVDDQPDRRPAAEAALQPVTLWNAVVHGLALPQEIDAGLDLVVELFRFLFERILRRCSRGHRVRLAQLLGDMYRCETRPGADPMPAKVLPTAFIGQLCTPPCLTEAMVMTRLGTFVALLDDWLDLACDIRAGAPNGFLGGGSTWSMQRLAATAFQVVGGRASHQRIATRLGLALTGTLDAAAGAGARTQYMVAAFVRRLLGTPHVE